MLGGCTNTGKEKSRGGLPSVGRPRRLNSITSVQEGPACGPEAAISRKARLQGGRVAGVWELHFGGDQGGELRPAYLGKPRFVLKM